MCLLMLVSPDGGLRDREAHGLRRNIGVWDDGQWKGGVVLGWRRGAEGGRVESDRIKLSHVGGSGTVWSSGVPRSGGSDPSLRKRLVPTACSVYARDWSWCHAMEASHTWL